ncbi:hypothetical protein ASE09_22420 [Streptomyces sp. Root66D1]|nr:hypothetical protein ASD33_17900 [Streptomyces sp. Root1304]KRA79217.1 hypothetical protein ASE09_22420 [Streptomyces sp. Root66D1]
MGEASGADRADELLALGLLSAGDLTTPVRRLSAGQRRELTRERARRGPEPTPAPSPVPAPAPDRP